VPAASPVFKPGDVYWLYNAKLAGWGPLAPGEDWLPSAAPEQFLNVNTTYASFQQDARVIDPAGFQDRPKEPRGVAVFALALPSPAFVASRLEATRPVLRVGATRVPPVIPGTTFQDTSEVPQPAPRPMPPAVITNPGTEGPPMVSPGPPPDQGPPGPPMQVVYPVPEYTGIVVLNPPEHPDYSRRNPNSQGGRGTPPSTAPVSRPPGINPPGQPGVPPRPGPAPPGPTTKPPAPPPVPSAPPAGPRVIVPGSSPGSTSLERPPTVPSPIARELPRAPRPESKPESKPDPKPTVKAETKPEAKPDTAQVKKQ
jgi:hypothetical protein